MKKLTKGARPANARRRKKKFKKVVKFIFNCGITILFLIIIVTSILDIREHERNTLHYKEALYDFEFGQSVEDFIDVNSYPREVFSIKRAEETASYLLYKKRSHLYIFAFKNSVLVEVFQGFQREMLLQVILQSSGSNCRCSMSRYPNFSNSERDRNE